MTYYLPFTPFALFVLASLPPCVCVCVYARNCVCVYFLLSHLRINYEHCSSVPLFFKMNFLRDIFVHYQSTVFNFSGFNINTILSSIFISILQIDTIMSFFAFFKNLQYKILQNLGIAFSCHDTLSSFNLKYLHRLSSLWHWYFWRT